MFEMIQGAPLVSVGLLAVGLALGLVAGNFVLPASRRAHRLQTEIERLRADQERYQRTVTEHFQTTAVLVGDLTSSYKAVYEHLASGARTLSDPALAAHGFGAPRLIVDGADEDLPREPIAHDRESTAETAPADQGLAVPGAEVAAGPPAAAGAGADSQTPDAEGLGTAAHEPDTAADKQDTSADERSGSRPLSG